MPKITPFLWFEKEAEAAAKLYTTIFKNSKILKVNYFFEDPHGRKASTVEFEIDGQRVIALNGGPHFKQTEAFSFVIDCADQAEVDYYWDKFLSSGGKASQCGWLKDQFGVSWQVTPRILIELNTSPNREAAQRAWQAMLKMTKIDIAALKKAFDRI